MPIGWGAVISAVAPAVVGAIAGGGGGSSGQPASGSTGQATSSGVPLDLFAQLMSGTSALNDLFGTGPSSLSGMTNTAAAAADPFAAQRAQYQPQLASTMTGMGNTIAGSASPTSSQNVALGKVQANAGGAQFNQNLNALSNPVASQQFAYNTGLDAMARNQSATGSLGSGAAMLAAQQYGQQSANQFQQQDFNNMATAQQLANQTQQQNFGQLSTANTATQAAQQQLFAQQQGYASGLAGLSGATSGSPSSAGSILAGQYGNQQTALLSLLNNIQSAPINSAINSLGSAAGSAAGGIGNWLNNLINPSTITTGDMNNVTAADMSSIGVPNSYNLGTSSAYTDYGNSSNFNLTDSTFSNTSSWGSF